MRQKIKNLFNSSLNTILLLIVWTLIVLALLGLGMLIGSFVRKEVKTEQTIPPVNDIEQILLLGNVRMTENEAEVYALLFDKYSKKYKIDWRIYPAIIEIESGWDASAVSSMGAKGLMQVMDSTFKMYCTRLRIPYRDNETIYNDVLNLTVGLEYLSRYIQIKGLEKGVKSYIGGPKYSESNQDCQKYYQQFKAYYSKYKAISQEYYEWDSKALNKALSN